MKKMILAASVAVLLMSSCSSSQKALNDLRDISNQINVEGSTYTVNQWKNTAQQYYKVDRKILKYTNKGEYTNAELEEIGELQGSCVSGFAKGVGQNVADKIKSAATIVKGISKGLIDGFTK